MRNLVSRIASAVLVCSSLPALADEASIRKSIAERMPDAPKIDEVRPSPVPGIWEIRLGNEIRYTDSTGTFLFEGEIFDLKARKNLTGDRIAQLSRIDFASLPFKDAVVWKNGNGKRRIAVFADPNCGFCKLFEKGLQEINDVTVYTFVIPILANDSREKARAIWCAKDNANAWRGWMLKGVLPVTPAASCDAAAIDRNLALSRSSRVNATPAIFLEDGSRIAGAVSPAELEKRLKVLVSSSSTTPPTQDSRMLSIM
ncbi:DsbC family protein [Roseateles sp. NT4]|uniref:DsbC family protein n=1 Tax=Roseateles sp. NT4 TaxID=3453715 RepID=UPI003EEC38EB